MIQMLNRRKTFFIVLILIEPNAPRADALRVLPGYCFDASFLCRPGEPVPLDTARFAICAHVDSR
jgi:hypothetical protein